MIRKALEKAGLAAAATEAQRQHENAQKLKYADEQTNKADETNQGFETPQDRANFHSDRRREWVEGNGTVTAGLEKLKEAFKNSGSDKPGSASLENFNIILDIEPLKLNNLIILALKKISNWF